MKKKDDKKESKGKKVKVTINPDLKDLVKEALLLTHRRRKERK